MALALSLQETNGSAADILDSDNEASDADSDTPPSSPYQGQLMDMGVSGRYVCLLAHGTHARHVGAVAGGHTAHVCGWRAVSVSHVVQLQPHAKR
jgi:hypothetical protein